jgi:hypothetical protein
MYSACLRRLKRKRVGRSYRWKVLEFFREWGVCDSGSDAM